MEEGFVKHDDWKMDEGLSSHPQIQRAAAQRSRREN
jgi:hypothetical protein